MGLDSEMEFDVHSDDAKKLSIPKLISCLKWCFQPSDFAVVEQILESREQRLEKEHGELDLKFHLLEDELKMYKRRVVELQKRNRDLESARRKADVQIEARKKNFEKLESWVRKLEEDTALLSKEPLFSARVDGKVTAGVADASFSEAMEEKKGSLQTQGHPVDKVHVMEVKESDPSDLIKKDEKPIKKELVSEATCLNNMMSSPMPTSRSTTPGEIIEISDSDDDMPKGKSSLLPCKRRHELHESDDDAPIGKHKREQLQEPIHAPAVGISDKGKSCTPSRQNCVYDLSESSDDSDSTSEQNPEKETWNSEADMLSSFEKKHELCLKAVCALYRNKCFEEKSLKWSLSSNNREFDKSEALRGTSLAEFLINGDPKGKLNKTITELKNHDPKGLDDCRRLATLYSKQLFKFYRTLYLPNINLH